MSLLAFITWKGLLENCEKRKPKVVFVANERWLFTRVFNCSMYFGWWENFGDLDGVVIVMRDGCKKKVSVLHFVIAYILIPDMKGTLKG